MHWQIGRHFPIGKIICAVLAVSIIVALLCFAPIILSYFQNPSSSLSASYTSLTLREMMNHTATIEFGDTEYNFDYTGGFLFDSTFISGSQMHSPKKGNVYDEFGIEVKVSDVSSDYVSNYIVILVKPTVQNYMASLHYTKVDIALYETKAVNISSGLINKTNEYGFAYTQVTHPSFNEPQLEIQTATQSKVYYVVASFTIRDFDIEVRVYKIESGHMIIYVKPLY